MNRFTYKTTKLACYIGYITQAIVINLMPVFFIIFQNEYNISFTRLGSLILLNFVVQIGLDVLAAKYIDKIGFRRAAIPAHIFSVLGLVGMGFLSQLMSDPYIGLIISVILFSLGGGLIEVVISPVIDLIPSSNSTGAMSLLHSFYCWGQLVVVLLSTLALNIFGYNSWKWISLFWAIIPAINIYLFMNVPLPETIKEKKEPIKSLFREKIFLLVILLMLGAGAAEQTMAQWASLFAQKGLQVSKIVGDLLGPCAFALLMALGRVWYGFNGGKQNLRSSLLGCSVLCVICYLVCVFENNPIVSLVACAVTGVSVSIMWPGVLSYAANCFPKSGAAMFGVMAIFGDIGCSLGPWVAGRVSDVVKGMPEVIEYVTTTGMNLDGVAMKAGILTSVIYPIIMIIGLILLKKNKKQL